MRGHMRGIDQSRHVAVLRLMGAPVALFLVAILPAKAQAEAGPAHKTVKVCNAELAERSGEIEKAGESPAAFFHACWTHATPGQPTPIEASAKVEARPEPATPARRARITPAPRAGRIVITRRRYTPIDEAPRERAPALVERRERFDPAPPPPPPLPPLVADTADTLGRVLRAAGLPPVQVPVLVPGPLRIVPVTIAPR